EEPKDSRRLAGLTAEQSPVDTTTKSDPSRNRPAIRRLRADRQFRLCAPALGGWPEDLPEVARAAKPVLLAEFAGGTRRFCGRAASERVARRGGSAPSWLLAIHGNGRSTAAWRLSHRFSG